MHVESTFRSKISFFTNFAAIDFQFDLNLLDICTGIKDGYIAFYRPKNDRIQFHRVPFGFQIISIYSKNAIERDNNFLKNTADCRFESYNKSGDLSPF